ncbi:MAG: DUF6455 family protein [Chromatiaceae bacterium]
MPSLYIDALSLIAWVVVIGAFFVWMVVRLVHDCVHIRRYRQKVAARAMRLRFSAMAERLGIRLTRLQREAGDVEFEYRLLTCEQCRATHDCDCYLKGETSDSPSAFCPNYPTLSAPSKAWRFLPGASPGRERNQEDCS